MWRHRRESLSGAVPHPSVLLPAGSLSAHLSGGCTGSCCRVPTEGLEAVVGWDKECRVYATGGFRWETGWYFHFSVRILRPTWDPWTGTLP